eukprot:TRINITY_DN10206_c0_g1_i1.p1 TRINITY_DN10206_c0_g1~~TRINITY_DN10206_c0_g1_i1.p1  ORF type:complete len:1093 (+),score=232.57 TRINITY_DN10206_c0_g1_i1:3-3281(+)
MEHRRKRKRRRRKKKPKTNNNTKNNTEVVKDDHKTRIKSWFSGLSLRERRCIMSIVDKDLAFLLVTMHERKARDGRGYFFEVGILDSCPDFSLKGISYNNNKKNRRRKGNNKTTSGMWRMKSRVERKPVRKRNGDNGRCMDDYFNTRHTTRDHISQNDENFCFTKFADVIDHDLIQTDMTEADQKLEDSVRLCDSFEYLDTTTLSLDILKDVNEFFRIMVLSSRGNFLTQPVKGCWIEEERNWNWSPKWFYEMGVYTFATYIQQKFEVQLWKAYWSHINEDPREDPQKSPKMPVSQKNNHDKQLRNKEHLVDFWATCSENVKTKIISRVGIAVKELLSEKLQDYSSYPEALSLLLRLSKQNISTLEVLQTPSEFIEFLYFSPLGRSDTHMDVIFRRIGLSIHTAYADKCSNDLILCEEAENKGKAARREKRRKRMIQEQKKREEEERAREEAKKAEEKKEEEHKALEKAREEEMRKKRNSRKLKQRSKSQSDSGSEIMYLATEPVRNKHRSAPKKGNNVQTNRRNPNENEASPRGRVSSEKTETYRKRNEHQIGNSIKGNTNSNMRGRSPSVPPSESQKNEKVVRANSAPRPRIVSRNPQSRAHLRPRNHNNTKNPPLPSSSQFRPTAHTRKISPNGKKSLRSVSPPPKSTNPKVPVKRKVSNPVLKFNPKGLNNRRKKTQRSAKIKSRTPTRTSQRERTVFFNSDKKPRLRGRTTKPTVRPKSNKSVSPPPRYQPRSTPERHQYLERDDPHPQIPHYWNEMNQQWFHPPVVDNLNHFTYNSVNYTYPIYHLSPVDKNIASEMNEYIREIVREMTTIVSKREVHYHKIHEYVKDIVKSLSPTAKVDIYGSYASNLSIPSSDIDLVVIDPENNVSILPTLAIILRRQDWVDSNSVNFIETATVPVIKLNTTSGFPVDITHPTNRYRHSGTKANTLVREYVQIYPALRPLALVLKEFLYQYGLNNTYTGGLGSYCLVHMIVVFLRLFNPDSSQNCLGVLLLQFLQLYGTHVTFENVAISVRNGVGKIYHASHGSSLFIVDPFNPVVNIGSSTFEMWKVKSSFARAYKENSSIFSLLPKMLEEESSKEHSQRNTK